MSRSLSLFILVIVLSGCSLLKPEFFWQPPRNMPSQFSLYSEEGAQSEPWWHEFDSNELNQLINQAVTDNFSIKEAWARLSQARYSAVKAGAGLYPDLSGSTSGSYLEQKIKEMGQSGDDEWLFGLSANYEVDLWGRIRAEKESKTVQSQASAEDLKAAMISVTSQIGENWISLISVYKQEDFFNKQLNLQNELLHLIKQRFPLAQSSALDIYQQQQTIEKIEAVLIRIKGSQRLIRQTLALLTGRAALEQTLVRQDFPEIKAVPAVGLPADLIARRPDIRAAGLRLQSTEWEIAAAKADRLPALTLTASYNASSAHITSIFDNWFVNLAANLSGPIFDGKQRKAEVERTKAVAEERLAVYGRTVFTAIKEVEDALIQEDQYFQTLISLNKQRVLSEKTMREAKTRYLNGSSDFVHVIKEELNNLTIQQDLITSREQRIIARIRLYKALGGSITTRFTYAGKDKK